MPFQDAGALRYLTFDSFIRHGLTHAVFTRRGGVSQGPYAELNVGATVGDEGENVEENLVRAFTAVGRPRNSIFDSWLVHGSNVLVAQAPRPAEWERPPQADIIVTNKPQVTLFMRYADCVPILLFDPVNEAIGLAHAGWRGTVQKVAAKAVEAMQQNYGSRPPDLSAAIGPSISARNYKIGEDVAAPAQEAFGAQAGFLLSRNNGSIHFDLPAANKLILEESGVTQISDAAICTFDRSDDWFSHRASGGRTGRFGALLALN